MIEYGYISTQSVRESIKLFLNLFSNPVVVLRSIDSSHSEKDIVNILEFHNFPYEMVNGNICIFEDQWMMINSDDLFSGFDEVWLFHKTPPTNDLRSVPYVTSDSIIFDKSLNQDILKVFQESGCVLFLGDGVGLNYITNDKKIFQLISKLKNF